MFVCMYVCLYVRLYVCLFVCLFVCWIYPPDRASFVTRGVHGKKRNLSAEVPIEKLTLTLLPLRAKTFATLISFYNFFLGDLFGEYTSLQWNGNSVVDYVIASEKLVQLIPLFNVGDFITLTT